ncbi:hypothetical protein [Streptomyces sp. NPDC002779]|uniref:hypothetical protein n=1 Tax=Streptomyces sp. NPDC002779 TaxID=3364664 RepID=UPI003690C76B
MVPTIFAAIVPSVLSTAAEVQERTAPHTVRLRALTTSLVLLLALALASCGAAISALVAYRNTALLVGLAFAGAWLLPAGAAWAPCVLTPIVMWLVGTGPQGRVEGWTLLLLPGSVTYASLISAAVLALAVTGYVARGARI